MEKSIEYLESKIAELIVTCDDLKEENEELKSIIKGLIEGNNVEDIDDIEDIDANAEANADANDEANVDVHIDYKNRYYARINEGINYEGINGECINGEGVNTEGINYVDVNDEGINYVDVVVTDITGESYELRDRKYKSRNDKCVIS
jgi:hypothetical protein